ncbi:MAG: Sec-independent protein translocase protein TatC [Planctomycetota bacterium]|jgi:Sec-independent protein secretion pathway component TatC
MFWRERQPSPAPSLDQPTDLGTMSFGDHLQELRTRVFRALIVPLPLAILLFFYAPEIRGILIRPLFAAQRANGQPEQVQALSPAETISTDMKLAIIAAIALSAPWILLQLWRFIEPGLYRHERRYVHFLVPLSGVLTLLGIALFYWVLLPFTLLFLVGFGASQPRTVPVPPPTTAETSVDGSTEGPSTTPPTTSPTTTSPFSGVLNVPVLDEDPAHPKAGDVWISAKTQVLRVAVPLQKISPNALVQATSDLSAAITGTGSDPAGTLSILEVPLTVVGGIAQVYRLSEYISFTLMLLLGSVVAFQLPVAILLLGWVGLITPKFLREKRRWAILIMAIIAAIVTPPDVMSMVLLLGPLWALYEFGILLLVFVPAHKVAAGRVFSGATGGRDAAQTAQTDSFDRQSYEDDDARLRGGVPRDDDDATRGGSS